MAHLPIIFWCWDKQGAEKQVLSRFWEKIKKFGSDLISAD